MTCPDCGTMTAVKQTDRLVPDAPTRRLRECRCGYRGLSLETWERRLPNAKTTKAVDTRPVQPCIDLDSPKQTCLGESKGDSDLISRSDPDPNPKVSLLSVTRVRAKSKPQAESPAFVAFYARYPRKKKRPRAWRAWVAQGCEDIADAVMAGLQRQLCELQDRPEDKVPHPASWLNDREWEDPATPISKPNGAVPFAVREEKERSARQIDARARSAFGGGR